MVEIIDSDARFGSSVKIYPENASSWVILAILKPILVRILSFSVKNVRKMFKKLCLTFYLNFYNFFPEIFFQRNQPRGKNSKDYFHNIFRFFRFLVLPNMPESAPKWAETQLKWLMKKRFRGKFSRWIRIWHQNP